MSDPLFSIITITRNNASGLKLTAKSISVQQQFTNFEWLVIDGASTDNTAEIVGEYATENTVFISEPDQGIYNAMNKGIDRATGKYLWFLNAGDCLSDAYILRDVSKQIQYNMAPDFIYGDARENGRIKKAHDASRFAWGQFTHHQAMMYRRNMIAELRYDQTYPIAADYAFTLQVLARAKKLFYYPRVLCDFLGGGISELQAIEARWENYYIRRDLLHMNPVKNKIIFHLNSLTHFLKTRLPFVYRLARISAR